MVVVEPADTDYCPPTPYCVRYPYQRVAHFFCYNTATTYLSNSCISQFGCSAPSYDVCSSGWGGLCRRTVSEIL